MQLYDYAFWQQPSWNINAILTKMGMLTNHFQPIVLAALVVLYGGQLTTTSKAVMLFYSLAAVVYTWATWTRLTITKIQPHCNCLRWDWNYGPYHRLFYALYILTVMVLFYEQFPKPLNIYLAIFAGLVTFLLGWWWVFKDTIAGRMYCWLGGFIPLLCIAWYLKAGAMARFSGNPR